MLKVQVSNEFHFDFPIDHKPIFLFQLGKHRLYRNWSRSIDSKLSTLFPLGNIYIGRLRSCHNGCCSVIGAPGSPHLTVPYNLLPFPVRLTMNLRSHPKTHLYISNRTPIFL